MATLNYSFKFKDGKFCLCCTVKGTSIRHYKVVNGLINPNWDKWNTRGQQFIDPSLDAINNNEHLKQIKSHWESIYLLASSNGIDLPNGKALFDYESKVKNSGIHNLSTLRGFLTALIDEMKNPETKIPSKNYQNYIAILHKLESQGTLLDVPISDVNDSHFEIFGSYLRKECNGVNYINLMKRFRAIINKAREKKLTKVFLSYDFFKDVPKSTNDHKKAQTDTSGGGNSLTLAQMNEFINLDLSLIKSGGPNRMFYKELYRDFCIFIYEMKMRPCDITKLRNSDIRRINGVECFSIVPAKKKNHIDSKKALQLAPITTKAREIIQKYSGMSSKGYIFPFSMNNYDWDFDNVKSFAKWYNKNQKQLEDINKFLKKVKPILKVKQLTNYTFRHSAFTHEIKAGKKNIMQIAKEGGTSVKMLEHHYFNHLCE